MTDLKPCPFCGSSAVALCMGMGAGSLIECEACSAQGAETDHGDESGDEAAALWNKRVGEPSVSTEPSEGYEPDWDHVRAKQAVMAPLAKEFDSVNARAAFLSTILKKQQAELDALMWGTEDRS